MANDRCIAIAILDQLSIGGPFKVMLISDENGDGMIYENEEQAKEALDGHILGAFIRIVPLEVVESY